MKRYRKVYAHEVEERRLAKVADEDAKRSAKLAEEDAKRSVKMAEEDAKRISSIADEDAKRFARIAEEDFLFKLAASIVSLIRDSAFSTNSTWNPSPVKLATAAPANAIQATTNYEVIDDDWVTEMLDAPVTSTPQATTHHSSENGNIPTTSSSIGDKPKSASTIRKYFAVLSPR